jgi:hypothetical protein
MRERAARARARRARQKKIHQPSTAIIREEGAAAFLLLLSWAERNSGRCEYARAGRARDDYTAPIAIISAHFICMWNCTMSFI